MVHDIPRHSIQLPCILGVVCCLYRPSASQQCPLYGAWQVLLVVFCVHQHSNDYIMHITPTLQHIQVFSGITRNNISLCCIRSDPLAFRGPSAPPQYLFITFLACFYTQIPTKNPNITPSRWSMTSPGNQYNSPVSLERLLSSTCHLHHSSVDYLVFGRAFRQCYVPDHTPMAI